MENSEIINSYKNQFKNSLIGKWTSAEGTFTMMYDSFEFFENGIGIWLSNDTEKRDFEWKQKAPYTIEIREQGEENWVEIMYTFKIIETDISKEVILCQDDSDTFYLAMTRISYEKSKA